MTGGRARATSRLRRGRGEAMADSAISTPRDCERHAWNSCPARWPSAARRWRTARSLRRCSGRRACLVAAARKRREDHDVLHGVREEAPGRRRLGSMVHPAVRRGRPQDGGRDLRFHGEARRDGNRRNRLLDPGNAPASRVCAGGGGGARRLGAWPSAVKRVIAHTFPDLGRPSASSRSAASRSLARARRRGPFAMSGAAEPGRRLWVSRLKASTSNPNGARVPQTPGVLPPRDLVDDLTSAPSGTCRVSYFAFGTNSPSMKTQSCARHSSSA